MMKKSIFTIITIVCTSVAVIAAGEMDPFVYDTLKGGIGIRSFSMGGASTAFADGDIATFYNPASLSVPGSKYRYENYDTNEDLNNVNDAHLFYRAPIGIGRWRKESLSGKSTEVTSIGYGNMSQNGVGWGINYKSIEADVGSGRDRAWGADFGTLIHMTPQFRVGVLAQDILSDGMEIPLTGRVGGAWQNFNRTLTLSSDLVFHDRPNEKKDVKVHYGAEYFLTRGFSVRGGGYEDYLTGGIAVQLPWFGLEYAVLIPNEAEDENGVEKENITMLGFNFGRGIKTRAMSSRKALFGNDAFVAFRVGGDLVSGKSEITLLSGAKVGSNDLLAAVHEAASTDSVKGFVIRIGQMNANLGSISLVQELRDELSRARRNGKQVVVYIENWASLPEYYLASVADKVVMPELGTISHLGVELEIKKSKRFLDKFGFEQNVIASGEFKGSLNGSSAPLSDDERAVVSEVIHSLHQQVIADIRKDRDLDWEKVGPVFDGRLISALDAKLLGLVDELGYWDSARQEVEVVLNTSSNVRIEPLAAYASPPKFGSVFSPFNRIAVIEVDGSINQGPNAQDAFIGGKSTGSDHIEQVLEIVRKDFSIKGVLIRVNSFGGSLLASDQIYTAIGKLKASGKRVYTSMGNVATSGGYYVALNSHKIFANPTTLTGSIGVISIFPNQAEFNDWLGFDVESIKTGEHMDMLSPNKKMTAKEKQMLKRYQAEKYNYFISKVSENRHLTSDEAVDVAQGQVFTGEQAKELKLVDELGNYFDAVDALAADVGIAGKPEVVVYRPQPQLTGASMMPRSGFLDRLLSF